MTDTNQLYNQLKSDFSWVDNGYEWQYMWNQLWTVTKAVIKDKDGYLQQDCNEFSQYGDSWQYMGSSRGINPLHMKEGHFDTSHMVEGLVQQAAGSWWLHTFRHRMHPATDDREYVHIPASRVYMEAYWKKLPYHPEQMLAPAEQLGITPEQDKAYDEYYAHTMKYEI